MRFVAAFAIALFIALVCTNVVKKAPFVLYALALVADAAYVYGLTSVGSATGVWAFFLPLMQRCTLAMAFLFIVMFIGTLAEGDSLRARLMPIRRQLSITGCLLALCHVFYYGYTYIQRVNMIMSSDAGHLSTNLTVALAISILLTILLVVLMVTSFMFVKTRMHAATWKKVQRWSYVFFALICIHLVVILLPGVLSGKEAATESVIVYSILFAAYALLRLRRRALENKAVQA